MRRTGCFRSPWSSWHLQVASLHLKPWIFLSASFGRILFMFNSSLCQRTDRSALYMTADCSRLQYRTLPSIPLSTITRNGRPVPGGIHYKLKMYSKMGAIDTNFSIITPKKLIFQRTICGGWRVVIIERIVPTYPGTEYTYITYNPSTAMVSFGIWIVIQRTEQKIELSHDRQGGGNHKANVLLIFFLH